MDRLNLMSKTRALWSAAVLWLTGWAYFGLPWNLRSRAGRFHQVDLVPLHHGRPRDLALNFLFYVPLGLIGMGLGWRAAYVLCAAALLSGGTEFAQIFSRGRFPSVTDLLLNTAGAFVGIVIAWGLRQWHERSTDATRPGRDKKRQARNGSAC
jgi:hypothetical protein